MSASKLISFILQYLNTNIILEGDFINIKNKVNNIKNANDVNEWLKYIKKIIGSRKYNILKGEFENSLLIDIGFSSEIPNLELNMFKNCLLYTSPSPRDGLLSRMPSSA